MTIACGCGIECVVSINLKLKLSNDKFCEESNSIRLIVSSFPNSFNLFSIKSFAKLVAYTGHLI